jgi:hypothetical protein
LKHATALAPIGPLTLQDVLDRIDRSPGLIDSRQRDLRSAVISYAKLRDAEPCFVALDLAAIRQVLDSAGDVAKMSPKRRANLRSDLASAIDASGLLPMLKTRAIALDAAWATLWHSITDLRIRNGISRFARWASANHIPPADVSDAIIQQFVAELEAKTLVRNIGDQRHNVAAAWNALAALHRACPRSSWRQGGPSPRASRGKASRRPCMRIWKTISHGVRYRTRLTTMRELTDCNPPPSACDVTTFIPQ